MFRRLPSIGDGLPTSVGFFIQEHRMDAHQSWLETGVDDDANYHEVTQKNALTHAAEFDKAEIVDDAMAQDWDMQAAHELIGSIVHCKDDVEIARLARAMFAKSITEATSFVAQKYL